MRKARLHEKILLSIIGIILISSPFSLTPTKYAYAGAGIGGGSAVVVIGDVINSPLLAGIAGLVGGLFSSYNIKEFALDPIAWAVAKLVIKQMTRSIVNWINSGFDGNPAFVTDLNGFLADVADQVIGSFIEGKGLGFLCDPFQLQIRTSLALKYKTFEDKISCRLTSVIDNVDNFLAGDFSEGGWPGWFELTTQDNPYVRYLQADAELSARLVNAKGQEVKLLDFGGGFLSWRECKDTNGPVGTPGYSIYGPNIQCETVTPGKFIESQLENVAGSGIRQLELADEIDEIVGALISQLVTQTLAGSGGLRGTSRSRFGQPSYIDRLGTDRSTTKSTGNAAADDIGRSMQKESEYKVVVERGLDAILSAEILNIELRSCDVSQADIFASQLTIKKTPVEEKIKVADNNLKKLSVARNTVLTTKKPEEALVATQKFSALIANRQLHNENDILDAGKESDKVEEEANALGTRIKDAVRACGGEIKGGGGGR